MHILFFSPICSKLEAIITHSTCQKFPKRCRDFSRLGWYFLQQLLQGPIVKHCSWLHGCTHTSTLCFTWKALWIEEISLPRAVSLTRMQEALRWYSMVSTDEGATNCSSFIVHQREESRKLKTRADIRHHCHSSHGHGPPTTKHGKPRRPHTDTSTSQTSSALHIWIHTKSTLIQQSQIPIYLSYVPVYTHSCDPATAHILQAGQCTELCKHADTHNDCNHFPRTYNHTNAHANCKSTV